MDGKLFLFFRRIIHLQESPERFYVKTMAIFRLLLATDDETKLDGPALTAAAQGYFPKEIPPPFSSFSWPNLAQCFIQSGHQFESLEMGRSKYLLGQTITFEENSALLGKY